MPENDKIQLPKGFKLDQGAGQPEVKLPKGFTLETADVKKKVGGEESSLTELSSKGFSPEQISLLQTGTKPPKPVGKTGGTTIIPTNITPDQKAYERELKRQDAAINTLKNTYSKKGLNFNEKSKRGQEQIAELLDKEINNDLTLVTGKDQKPYLVRGEGFLESAGRGILRSIIDPIESTKINFTNDAVELADLLDEKIKEEPNVPESAPTRVGGYLGELAGGLPKMMALLAIPVAGESAMVGEMYHNALANQRRVLYERGLQEGMDRTTAAQNAMKNAPITAIPDAIVGAALARGVGGKAAGTEIIPNAAKESFLKATGNGLKGVAKVSGIGGAAEFGRSKAEQQLGYNVTDAEAIENGLRGMGEYAIMDAAFKLAHSGPKYLSSAAKNLLSSVPKEVLEVAAEKYPDGKQTLEDVAKFTETKAKVQDFVPEEKVAAVTGLTEKVQNLENNIKELEERKKTSSQALHPFMDGWIKEYQDEIDFYKKQVDKVVKSKDPTGVVEEIDDVTGLKAGQAPEVVEEKVEDITQFPETLKAKPVKELTERQLNRREKLRIDDVVDRVESGDIKGSNISVGDKDLTEVLIDKGLDGREAYMVKDTIERVINPLKNITDKIDPQEVKFFTENVEDINSVIEGLEDARTTLFLRNKDVVDNVNKEAKRLLDYYSDKNNLPENKLDNEKTFEATADLLNKFLNGDVNYLDLSKFGIEKNVKDYYKQKAKEYAVQKPSPEGVLQPEQERVRETGGERKRVEPSVKGKEIAKEGKQVKINEEINYKDLVNNPEIFEKNKKEIVNQYSGFGSDKNSVPQLSKIKRQIKVGDKINWGGVEYVVLEVKSDLPEDKYNSGTKKNPNVYLANVDKNGNLVKIERTEPIEPVKKTYQEALKEKQETEKKQTRQAAGEKAAVSRRIFDRVFKMDVPEDAEQIALRYLADGGKVSKEAVDEAYGSTKRAELNVRRRELLSEEVKSKDFVQGNESLDDTVHRLWEDNKQRVSEREIKDKLMAEIGNNNTRLEAAEAYLEKYNAEYKIEKEELRLAEQEKEKYLEEQEQLEKELRNELDEQIEGEASEEHINNLIKQYEAEIKAEDQQLRSESEGEINKEVSERKAVEKTSEEGLAKEYKEVIGKASKKAKENAKKDFVDRNFDSIVAKLKIQIKCPT